MRTKAEMTSRLRVQAKAPSLGIPPDSRGPDHSSSRPGRQGQPKPPGARWLRFDRKDLAITFAQTAQAPVGFVLSPGRPEPRTVPGLVVGLVAHVLGVVVRRSDPLAPSAGRGPG